MFAVDRTSGPASVARPQLQLRIALVAIAIVIATSIQHSSASPQDGSWLTSLCKHQLMGPAVGAKGYDEQLNLVAGRLAQQLRIRKADVLQACQTAAAKLQQLSQQQPAGLRARLLQQGLVSPSNDTFPSQQSDANTSPISAITFLDPNITSLSLSSSQVAAALPLQTAPPRPPSPPPRPPPSPPPPVADRIQPRLSIHVLSSRASNDLYRIMYLMAIQYLYNEGPTSGDWSFYGVGAVHGRATTYNRQSSGRGFCLHQQTGFAPWHRPYVKCYELALRDSCKTVAKRFKNAARKQQALFTCDLLRSPYWDVTRRSIPTLLTASGVRVYNSNGTRLTTINNPLARHCYRVSVSSSNDGVRAAGSCTVRSPFWQTAMVNLATSFAANINSFISSTWDCSYRSSFPCPGNLEAYHDDVHNTLGGNGGEMSTLSFAPSDPAFWLHHANVDRVTFLFQVRAGQYRGGAQWSPFPSRCDCGSDIGACGYSYGSSITASTTSSIGLRRLLNGTYDDTSGGDPTAPKAKRYLQQYLDELTGGYNGYWWSLVFNQLNPYALKNRRYSLHVLINGMYGEPLPMQDGRIEIGKLQSRLDYCGAYSGFMTFVPDMMAHEQNVSATVSLNPCLQRNGYNPDIQPKNPADYTQGPLESPLKRDSIRLLCVDSKGKDCTSRIQGSYAVNLGWTVTTTNYVPEAQTFAHSGSQASGAAGAATTAGSQGQRDCTDLEGKAACLFSQYVSF